MLLLALTHIATLVLGLIVGFYAWTIYWRIKRIYDLVKDGLDTPGGVVRPNVSRVTKHTPIDLSGDAGPIRRMTPDEIKLANLKEREERARNL